MHLEGEHVQVRHHVPLAPLTTLGLGGPADTVLTMEHSSDIEEIARWSQQQGARPLALGGGSNVLVSDAGCRSPIIHVLTRGIAFEPTDDQYVLVHAEAGHELQDLVSQTVAQGLSGMETLTGIPGTVGATPVQNVGAYGQETADTLVEVDAYDWVEEHRVTLDAVSCALGHRTSIFKHSSRWTILRVTFRLSRSELSRPIDYRMVAETLGVAPGTRVALADAEQAVLEVRGRKGMVLNPKDPDNRSAGSVFLSPAIDAGLARQLREVQAPVHGFPDGSTRVSASWLIQAAGFHLGQQLAQGVRISGKHFTLVADDGATAAAFAHASALVADTVLTHTGVQLSPEPDLFGECDVYAELALRGRGQTKPGRNPVGAGLR